MRKALGTAALGLAGLGLGLAAGALPAAAAGGGLELSKGRLALALGLGLWTRALASGFAGALVDRFGGRRALRDASVGSAAAAAGLGLLFLGGREGALFAGVAILHAAACYFSAFAGPAAARLNAIRLEPALRGRHAGLYGALAFPAEFLALPAGLWLGARLPAQAFVFLPAAAALLALGAVLVGPSEEADARPGPGLGELRVLASRAEVLVPAALEGCAGAVRWGLLGWSWQFLREVHQVRPGGPLFLPALAAVAAGAFLGPVAGGFLSDKGFRGRRAPAAFVLFALMAAGLAGLGRALEPATAVAFLGTACGAAFGVHALLSGAAAMDAGGRRSAGAISGLLDGFHHAAGGLAVLIVGALVDRGGWGSWTAVLIPFSLFGAAASLALARLRAEAPDPSL